MSLLVKITTLFHTQTFLPMQLTKIQQVLIEKIIRRPQVDNTLYSYVFDIESLEQTIGRKLPQPLLELLALYDNIGDDIPVNTDVFLYEEEEDPFGYFETPLEWERIYNSNMEDYENYKEFCEFVPYMPDPSDYLVFGFTRISASIAIGLRNEIEGQIFWMNFRDLDDFKYFKIADSFLEFVEML